MNDTLLGVLIGAAGGVATSLFAYLGQIYAQHSKTCHEIKMKQIELYQAPRREALEKYMHYLGKMASGSISEKEAYENYFAFANRASLYVNDETRALIRKASDLVLKAWNETGKGVTSRTIVESPVMNELYVSIAHELRSAMDELATPQSRRTKEKKKANSGNEKNSD